MSDDDDGGEHTNAEFYKHVWTKPIKKRVEPKKAKTKFTSILVATLQAIEQKRTRSVKHNPR